MNWPIDFYLPLWYTYRQGKKQTNNRGGQWESLCDIAGIPMGEEDDDIEIEITEARKVRKR